MIKASRLIKGVMRALEAHKENAMEREKLGLDSLHFSVKVRAIGKEMLLAGASVVINGSLVINDVLIKSGNRGPWVSLPAKKGKDGEWRDIFHPITKEAREAFNAAVLEAYDSLPHMEEPGRNVTEKKQEDSLPF